MEPAGELAAALQGIFNLPCEAYEFQAYRRLPGGQLGLRRAQAGRPVRVLNLFAYFRRGPRCGMWNAAASGLADRPIHWIVDDCGKFIQREIRRGRKYDGIIMDPPSYGRGPSGEIWKMEKDF